MSTKKKGKGNSPAKQERVVLAKRKSAVPHHVTTLDGRHGKFWTMWIEPRGAALLSQTLRPCHFVIKNHGSYNLRLVALGGDLMDLSAGTVRATYARGTITVENKGEKWVLIEFEFLPIHR